jgi:tRNA modification GTPase
MTAGWTRTWGSARSSLSAAVARDTIFALSSGRPPAAIAVIRISGPLAHESAKRLAGDLPQPREAAVRTLRDPQTSEQLDEALVLRFDGPASATGEDVVELHCHGGRAVVDAVLAALAGFDGVRAAEPGEFTRRAFENGRIDLTEAEGLADLLEAETEAQRRAALRLAEGGLRRQIELWRERVVALSAEAELAIDYVEEGPEEGGSTIAADAGAFAGELEEWLARPRAERLKDGVRVVAAGPPNAGKSSLINAIAGTERIIVSELAGTTRDVIEVPLGIAGRPFLLIDTAGLRSSSDAIETIGIGRAEHEIDQADILLWLGAEADAPAHPRRVLVHAKADLGGRPRARIPVSAVTGEGLGELLERILALSDDLLPAPDTIALNRRQADALGEARSALAGAAATRDPVLQAEGLRLARAAFDRLTGRAGVEDLLDALFGRFCLGK